MSGGRLGAGREKKWACEQVKRADVVHPSAALIYISSVECLLTSATGLVGPRAYLTIEKSTRPARPGPVQTGSNVPCSNRLALWAPIGSIRLHNDQWPKIMTPTTGPSWPISSGASGGANMAAAANYNALGGHGGGHDDGLSSLIAATTQVVVRMPAEGQFYVAIQKSVRNQSILAGPRAARPDLRAFQRIFAAEGERFMLGGGDSGAEMRRLIVVAGLLHWPLFLPYRVRQLMFYEKPSRSPPPPERKSWICGLSN